MNNINDIVPKPLMFGPAYKSSYALCDDTGKIIQLFHDLNSAKYMLTEYKMGVIIYEVIEVKGKLIANLGEVLNKFEVMECPF